MTMMICIIRWPNSDQSERYEISSILSATALSVSSHKDHRKPAIVTAHVAESMCSLCVEKILKALVPDIMSSLQSGAKSL